MRANPYSKDANLNAALARDDSALQHIQQNAGPRPLPLFLALVQAHHAKRPTEAAQALIGLRKLQAAITPSQLPLAPIVALSGRAALRDYGDPQQRDAPHVVFVPSLINPPNILDITQERSILRWLSANGLHPYLVDWGQVTAADRNLSVAHHVSDILIPLLHSITQPVHLVGYCLGGTMALAAAHLHPVQSLTMIAAPWHFEHYPDASTEAMETLWQIAHIGADQIGLLPVEALQTLFWQLDPSGTVQKYAGFADIEPASDDAQLFLAMEAWANGGAPLPFAAAQELFEDFIANNLPGRGKWRVGGQIITPSTLTCPVLDIVSLNDRIVPAATASGLPNRLEINRGHVGMITGSQAKAQLWEPLREWLSQPHKS